MEAVIRAGCVLGGKYVVRERIGEGGMGTVFLADQPSLARTVAIKVLHPALATNRDIARRFREEAVSASRVHHPRSVTIIDCNTLADGTPYIVMEHVRGCSLGRLIAEDDLSLARVIDLVQQILSAVDAAHSAGVVHADIKSENFLVESLDDSDHVTLIDYGLARASGIDCGIDGVVSGTPEYMAPEVIRGETPRPASDLYAVGVVLYELLTGMTPFAGGSTAEIMERHLEDVVIPPSFRCDRDLPRALDAVVVRALAKDPDDRFASAREFAAALADACANVRATTARPSRRDIARPESPTRNCGVPERLARGSGHNAIATREELRRALGNAIVAGNVDRIVTGYVLLARMLASEDCFGMAVCELEEALDLVGRDRRLLAVLDELYASA